MTRKRFSKIQKAILIYVVNKSTDSNMKKLNKVIYRADFGSSPGKHDWLRNSKLLNSYQDAYDFLCKDIHEKMMKEVN